MISNRNWFDEPRVLLPNCRKTNTLSKHWPTSSNPRNQFPPLPSSVPIRGWADKVRLAPYSLWLKASLRSLALRVLRCDVLLTLSMQSFRLTLLYMYDRWCALNLRLARSSVLRCLASFSGYRISGKTTRIEIERRSDQRLSTSPMRNSVKMLKAAPVMPNLPNEWYN